MRTVATAALLLAVACGEQAPCIDEDGDGFGEACSAGADCDAADGQIHLDCEGVDCRDDPYARGCACQGSAAHACFSGPEEALAFGACVSGTQYCSRGAWTQCEGQVSPVYERCNGEDDDCDGVVDEGVLSPCGGCDVNCYGAVWGGPTAPFEVRDPLVVNARNELTLAYESPSFSLLWVANTDGGSASRVNAEAMRETARYALPGSPRRVAVDYEGAAYFLSEAADGWYLSKVAAEATACTDADEDGLRTSTGPDDELPLGEDECVLFSRKIAEPADEALALAVDGTRILDGPSGGDIWVGSSSPPLLQRFSGVTGDKRAEVELPFSQPQDAAFDLAGRLWVLDRGGVLLRVDQAAGVPEVASIEVPRACYRLEALAIDPAGRLYLSTFDCESVMSFEPSSERFLSRETEGLLTTRGIGTYGDDVYVAHTAGSVSRLDKASLQFLDTTALYGGLGGLGSPSETIGLAVGSDGTVWTTSRGTSDSEFGLLSRIDGQDMRLSAQISVGRGPRALGDFAGSRLIGSYLSGGQASRVFSGCEVAGPTRWLNLHVRYTSGPGGGLAFAVRWAESEAELSKATFEPLATLPPDVLPISLSGLPKGGVIEVRVTLTSGDHIGAPALGQLGIEWGCEAPS